MSRFDDRKRRREKWCAKKHRGLETRQVAAPFPPPAHRTGQADCPHPALGRRSERPRTSFSAKTPRQTAQGIRCPR
jgi:hypothetical protein